MKRLFALLLVVAMLLSLCVLPASAADEQSKMSVASFTTYTYDTDTNNVTIGEPKTTPYEKGDLVAVKVTFHNAEEKAIQLTSIQMVMEYDRSAVEPVFWKDPDFGTVYGYAVAASTFGMSLQANEIEAGKVKLGGASAGVKVAAGATVDVAYYLFKVKSEVEAGDAGFALEISELTKKTTSGKESIKDSVLLEGNSVPVAGNPPELASVSIDRPTIEYGSAETLKLTATSTSGKDITSLVDFKVQKDGTDCEGFAITEDGKLTIGSNSVGTYTVVATPKTDGSCTIAENVTYAAFTIAQKEITSLSSVDVTGFVKGNTVQTVMFAHDNFLNLSYDFYEGTGDMTGKTALADTDMFKAEKTYTLVLTLTLKDSTNYKLADNLSATVKGFGEDQTATLGADGKITLTATTGKKDKTRSKGNLTIKSSKTPYYDDTLSQFELNTTEAQAVADVNGVETVIPGDFVWKDPNEKVGKGGQYNSHTVVFKPSGEYADLYEGFEWPISFFVQKKIFNLSEHVWTWNSDTFTYTGEPKSITLNIPSDLEGLVDVTYDTTEGRTNTATDAGTYTVAATLTLRDAENYIFSGASSADGSSHTVTTTWTINKADWTYTATQGTSVCYGPAQDVVITPASLGLPAEKCAADIITIGIGEDLLHTGYSIDKETGNVTISLRETTLAEATANATDMFTLKYTFDNYNDVTITYTITITEKNSDTTTMKFTVDNVQYGIGAAPSFSELPAGVTANQVTITYSGNAQTYTPDNIADAPVGDYTATARYESSDTIYTATATFRIFPRDISSGIGVTIDFGESLTYNGNPQPQTMTVKVGTTELKLGEDYVLSGDSLTQKDAGDYTVVINGKENSNYMGTLRAKFTIAKATPAASDFTFTAPADLTYDGNPKVASVTTTNTEIGTVTVFYDPAVPTNAGKYTVKISTAETKNYKPVTDLTADDWKFTITPKPVTVTVAVQDKVYNGTTTATITGTLTGVLDKDAANVTLTAPTATFPSKNVGEQTLIVTGEFTLSGSAAGNYEITQPALNNLTASITAKPLEALADLTADVRYDNLDEQTVTVPAPEGLISGDEQYVTCVITRVDTGDKRLESAPGYENGKITFQLKDKQEKTAQLKYKVELNYGNNYANKVVTFLYINISIRSAQSTLTYTGATSVAYDQSITLTSAGGSGTGAVTYAIVGGGDGAATISGNVLTATKAGTVKIQVTKAGDKDYLATTSAVYDITVTKATPAAPAEIKVDNTDTTLGELGRDMVNKIDVRGTIEWYGPDGKKITDPDNTKIEANKEYSWTFLPDDSDNYNEIRGTTTPYVRDDLSWLPGVINGGSNFTFHDVNRFDYYYDSVKWAADNGIASGTSRFTFSPDAVCTRAQTVTFLWRAAGSPLPRYRVSPFTDVHSYDYYYEAVLWAVEQGITTGLTATTFGPDETVTRGQVATFLYRAASAAKPNTFNPFTDVKPTAYNYDAILWAYDNRITTGTSTTTFSPDAFCTRAQIVTFLYRYYQGR